MLSFSMPALCRQSDLLVAIFMLSVFMGSAFIVSAFIVSDFFIVSMLVWALALPAVTPRTRATARQRRQNYEWS